MKPVRSLRFRLLLLLLVLLPAIWLASLGAVWFRIERELAEFFDHEMHLVAHTLLLTRYAPASAAMSVPLTEQDVTPEEDGDDILDTLAFRVVDGSGKVVLQRGAPLPYRPGAQTGTSRLEWHGQDWHVVTERDPERGTVAWVAQSQQQRQVLTTRLALGQLAPWLLGLPLLAVALIWGVSLGLRPLRELTRQLSLRGADDMTPLTEAVPAELHPLIAGLNRWLARADAARERERRFTADAAHELRTPIAGLRLQAELASEMSGPARDHALGQVATGLERLSRLAEQLLARNRLDSAAPATAPFDWPPVIEKVLEAEQDVARSRHVTLSSDLKSAKPWVGDAALAGVLLRNLVDNAVRYTRPDGQVAVVLEGDTLTVSDDGPGLPALVRTRLGERFVRPPGQDEPGSGLGLSLVLDAARAQGWTVEFGHGTLGGLAVTVRPAPTGEDKGQAED